MGLFLSGTGYHFTIVATFVQVFELTGSTVAVGLVGFVGLVGIVIGIVVGGTFIDAVDRRRTLLVLRSAPRSEARSCCSAR